MCGVGARVLPELQADLDAYAAERFEEKVADEERCLVLLGVEVLSLSAAGFTIPGVEVRVVGKPQAAPADLARQECRTRRPEAGEPMKKIKSNDPMPARTQANLSAFAEQVCGWRSPHRRSAVTYMNAIGLRALFEILHSMRRWYSGQTMARLLASYRPALLGVMKIEPRDSLGVFRGFKVPNSHAWADADPGDTLTLPVKLNHGHSSWSTSEAPTHKFSGGGKGKTGLVVKLIDTKGVKPLLAPTHKTKPWFNALYEHVIGKSFRPKEQEYLLAADRVKVRVVRVKKR